MIILVMFPCESIKEKCIQRLKYYITLLGFILFFYFLLFFIFIIFSFIFIIYIILSGLRKYTNPVV